MSTIMFCLYFRHLLNFSRTFQKLPTVVIPLFSLLRWPGLLFSHIASDYPNCFPITTEMTYLLFEPLCNTLENHSIRHTPSRSFLLQAATTRNKCPTEIFIFSRLLLLSGDHVLLLSEPSMMLLTLFESNAYLQFLLCWTDCRDGMQVLDNILPYTRHKWFRCYWDEEKHSPETFEDLTVRAL